jgi:hypothetical protein
VLLSDRDIKAEISAGRVKVEPFDGAMIQPSSVDATCQPFVLLNISVKTKACLRTKRQSYLLSMSTVQKNETANRFPIEQKEGSLPFLAIRLRRDRAQTQHCRRSRKFSSFSVSPKPRADDMETQTFKYALFA